MSESVSVAIARRAESVGREAMVQGWVRTRRNSKAGFSFLEINDGSCFGNVQVVAGANLPNYESEIKHLSPGCSVGVSGVVQASPGKGQATEIHATAVVVYGTADVAAYPLQKKGHSFEFLRTIAHLRPRTNTFGAVARVRNCVCHSIHQFFQERGFLYVHTPIITASDCEGAGAMFRVTTADLEHLDKVPRRGPSADFTQDFFDRPSFLTVSGQLEAEAFACSLGKTYTFGPTFRAENSNTPRHLAEFWMIEPEVAFCDLWADMELAEGLLKRIFRDVLEKCAEDVQFFNERIDKTVLDTLRHVTESQFLRVSYSEAIEILKSSGQTFEFPTAVGQRPAIGTRTLFDRKAFPVSGHLVRLSAHDQAVLHASERRRPHRSRDGRAGAEGRRDHRRQPAGRTARNARSADARTGARSRELLVVSRPAALRHRAARRLRAGPGTRAVVHHRHGEHPRRDPLPTHAGQRGILKEIAVADETRTLALGSGESGALHSSVSCPASLRVAVERFASDPPLECLGTCSMPPRALRPAAQPSADLPA